MPLPRDLIDSAEAARLLDISIENLHQRVFRGLLPAEKFGRSLVFDKQLIKKLAAQPAGVTISDHVKVVTKEMKSKERKK